MAERSRTLVVGLLVLVLASTACDLPTLREARRRADALPETSFLYAADGTPITRVHAGVDRVSVGARRIPDIVRDAVIAVEDQRFYDHKGLDLRALLRAAYIDATTGAVVEGGSTITQQLVKNVYVGGEVTLTRKIREAYLAWELEHRLTKEQILTRYLNTVYFGNGAYGIRAAAETYFDKQPLELTLEEAALLAGLIAAPVDFDPVTHPARAKARRKRTLRAMLELGAISQERYQQAIATPITLNLSAEDDFHYVAPYFIDYVKEWFLSNPRFGETPQERYDLLFEGGLRIVTTLDLRMQAAAERAVSSVLTEPGDPYGALTAIDPRTGFVHAMVGGRDYWNEDDRFARINLATGGSTGRQAGSAFKPFALVAALEHGVTRSQPLNGSSAHVLLQNGTYWDPQNAEGGGYGTISLESATVNSVNIAYANLLSVIGAGDTYAGAAATVEAAVRMGIRCCPRTNEPNGPLAAVPSAVLGVNEVSTLEMASAYGTLAFAGQHVQPTPVISITTQEGEVIYQANSAPEPAVDPAIAAEAVDILSGVVSGGTGTGANIGRPQFGKTGTAQNASDAWFVGAVPQLAAAVWVGFPQGQIPMCCGSVRISTVYGGTWPASIWKAFMLEATSNMPIKEFPDAPDVEYVTLRVDVTQGCLANPYTLPQNIDVFEFLAGTEPTLEVCTEPSEYQLLIVPSVIGLQRDAAISTLRSSGFDVAVELVPSEQPEGTVIGQDPAAGQRLIQTGTVTIAVAKAETEPSPPPVVVVVVPDVVGLTQGAATSALHQAGFEVAVSAEQECDPLDPACEYRQGVVWAQSPSGGSEIPDGSTVTIVVNP
ncbi:MAG TPA: transglycosylase domain-containing protein [Actinomycetota bacterium]|nr:transglycosylase domain-containing protein [Actinomycetota bacterium]